MAFLINTNIVYGQTSTVNLRHLTKEQYIIQIEQSSDSAYKLEVLENN